MDKKLKFEGFPNKYKYILSDFFQCYREATGGHDVVLHQYLQLLEKQLKEPFRFEAYHKKVRSPIDYYQFGINFIKPLIDLPKSNLLGEEILKQIERQLQAKENVVLLANHQTETDPQAITILLEKHYPHIGEKIIYVAGERVITDLVAIPFSMGCDLLCIYSKRYIDYPPEMKEQKLLHNKNTMRLMSSLLQEGGKIIYVAPSGGRDRKNLNGEVEVAPFDPASIEMFYLMAKRAKTPTHFYPFTLATYDILPPPEAVQKELGEKRIVRRGPIHMAFAPEFDMEIFPGSEENDKIVRRKARADAIWGVVNSYYQRLK